LPAMRFSSATVEFFPRSDKRGAAGRAGSQFEERLFALPPPPSRCERSGQSKVCVQRASVQDERITPPPERVVEERVGALRREDARRGRLPSAACTALCFPVNQGQGGELGCVPETGRVLLVLPVYDRKAASYFPHHKIHDVVGSPWRGCAPSPSSMLRVASNSNRPFPRPSP